MEWVGIAVVGTVVSILWFLRDIRKQNGLILKSLAEILLDQSKILQRIEEGQREGFRRMEEGFRRMEEAQREGFKTLAQILRDVAEILRDVSKIAKAIYDKI